MDTSKRPALKLIQTGVPGLDELCGGGIPEYSFNLVAGPPGSGKTTLAHQILFANATEEQPALYFTVVGEPALKMLRYQQQLGFFDATKIGTAVRFVDLSQDILTGDLDAVLAKMIAQMRAVNPRFVVVDSFRTVLRAYVGGSAREASLQLFLQKLGLTLSSWEATSFLIGEYAEHELNDNPVFTVSDGIFWLTQAKERSATVRKLQIVKMRGRNSMSGLHTFRIESSGLVVFPRKSWRLTPELPVPSQLRLNTGINGLDALIGGGIPAGDTTLVAGPSGVGKTMFSTQFLHEGGKRGETGVLAIFEERPVDYLARAKALGFDLGALVDKGLLTVVELRPFDLSADEILHEVQLAVARTSAKRLVIDSMNGLELSLAPNFREDFRESLYRTLGGLSSGGVSVVLTVEVTESFNHVSFSPHEISFMSQNILFLRWVEIDGRLHKVLGIVKMRRSAHSTALHSYNITAQGLEVGAPLTQYEGVLGGIARMKPRPWQSAWSNLTAQQMALLDLLDRAGSRSRDQLTEALAMSDAELTTALERLEALVYLERADDGRYRLTTPAP